MKESITKFDLESAFKALDEIDIPVTGKVKANRPALAEIFSRKTKLDSLIEEYYDISDTAELDDAKEAREAEVAKAKLARIEKIVDLEADSPEDLLTSYVGKYIMQCPQCMTLFYKNQEDIVESEDDSSTVNVGEVCQHCGNESGYTLVGKVGEAEPGEFTDETQELEIPETELPEEVPSEDNPAEEGELEDLGDLDGLDLDLEAETEEDKKEESFTTHEGETLVEEFEEDIQLDAKLKAHSEYIEYLRNAIAQEEQSLEKATNEQIKVAIQRNISAYQADLESALPEAVKNNTAIPEEPVEDKASEPVAQKEACSVATDDVVLTENLHEDADLDVSAEEFEELISSSEFKKPISDAEIRTLINDEKEAEEEKQPANENFCAIADVDEIQESALETLISNSLVEAYGNVAGFRLTECSYVDNNFMVDGTIYFTSGNTRKTTYKFTESCKVKEGKISLSGINEKLGADKQFTLIGRVDNKTLITESFCRNK